MILLLLNLFFFLLSTYALAWHINYRLTLLDLESVSNGWNGTWTSIIIWTFNLLSNLAAVILYFNRGLK